LLNGVKLDTKEINILDVLKQKNKRVRIKVDIVKVQENNKTI